MFIPNFVCVLINEKYKTYQTGFYYFIWVMPQGWDFGALGCLGDKKNNILNMVMWHIKLTVITRNLNLDVSHYSVDLPLLIEYVCDSSNGSHYVVHLYLQFLLNY